ncbi:hypothetical protein LIER_33036 [Lithospermum erythrorhizon]|uniref:Uncharacterized protein n=1 Tax=Lithospermum erythrorhizon TaxID=34254 RepID=A0AAV3RVM7_LITER
MLMRRLEMCIDLVKLAVKFVLFFFEAVALVMSQQSSSSTSTAVTYISQFHMKYYLSSFIEGTFQVYEEKWVVKDEVGLMKKMVFVYGMFPEAFHRLDSDVVFLKCSGRLITYRILVRNLEFVNRKTQSVGSTFEW